MPELKVGQMSIDFETVDQDSNKVRLSDLRGKTVVLYFYPKDNTPGCTAEACSFRDDSSDLEKAGVKVLGISADGVKSHKRFEQKYGLNFTLLADASKEIIERYGAKGKFGTARRVTYLIDSGNHCPEIYWLYRGIDFAGGTDDHPTFQ